MHSPWFTITIYKFTLASNMIKKKKIALKGTIREVGQGGSHLTCHVVIPSILLSDSYDIGSINLLCLDHLFMHGL